MNHARYDLQGSRQYYALTTANAIRRRWHLNKLRLFHLTEISSDDRLLDAGCGAGNLVFELASRCRAAIGCDIQFNRLIFGAQRGQGTYVQGHLQQLPFADKTFNTIFCMEVLEHIERGITVQILHEFSRILKPQGQLLITTPNYRSLWALIEFLADTLRLAPEIAGGEHISKYRWRTLADLLTMAGFAIQQMGTFNYLSPFVALLSERWAEHLYRWELREGRVGGNLLYALCRKL